MFLDRLGRNGKEVLLVLKIEGCEGYLKVSVERGAGARSYLCISLPFSRLFL